MTSSIFEESVLKSDHRLGTSTSEEPHIEQIGRCIVNLGPYFLKRINIWTIFWQWKKLYAYLFKPGLNLFVSIGFGIAKLISFRSGFCKRVIEGIKWFSRSSS